MRISELSATSGLSVPTIKFYLREGLLHRGAATASNQAEYDDGHVRRLRLIRVLIEIGNLPLSSVRSVLAALQREDLPVHIVAGVAQYALGPHRDAEPDEDTRAALADVDAFLERRRWRVGPESPSRRALAEALVALRRLDRADDADLDHYADVTSDLASWELDRTTLEDSRADAIEGVVVGTVVFEAVLNALRRLAHEDHSARRAPGRNRGRGRRSRMRA